MKNTFYIIFLMLCSITFAKADCFNGTADKKQDFIDCLAYAERGNRNVQYNLGVMYYFGEGVAQDYNEALKWYRKSAEQGYVHAQFGLGYIYHLGHGVAQNYNEASKWYRKSALQGNANAQCSLGFMYHMGHGVSQDYKEAFKWYRKSAEQENVNAQYNLAALYSNGKGVPQDYVMSHMYLNVAWANGDKKAKVFRDVIAKAMTSAQIKKARKLAFKWVDNH